MGVWALFPYNEHFPANQALSVKIYNSVGHDKPKPFFQDVSDTVLGLIQLLSHPAISYLDFDDSANGKRQAVGRLW